MIPSNLLSRIPICAAVALVSACSEPTSYETTADQPASEVTEATLGPTAFEVDPFWPKQLPNNWILGDVAGIATDANDHVWIVQRPASLHERETGAMKNPPEAECCATAPSVMEFDPEGNLLRAWGNPDTTQAWITVEHGIFIDQQSNVWIGGAANDHVVMKFTANGRPLLQIGQLGQTNGSNDTTLLGSPADMFVDTPANEVYIADGYRNKRVVVFDATTGQHKRHWGAYGNPPSDDALAPYSPADPPLPGFRNAVHAVIIANDNLVYVADRMNDRIQVFNKDGSFVSEARLAPQTLGTGSVWDFELSADPAQTYLYVADGMNMKIWILNRSTLQVVGTLGHGGRNAGQFGWLHNIAMDSKGNLYTAEVTPGKRIQKFRPTRTE